jgi:hypothetical protein
MLQRLLIAVISLLLGKILVVNELKKMVVQDQDAICF